MKSSTMKRKLLTMLLVFAVVASYIPFDRAFAGTAEKTEKTQKEKKVGKETGKAGKADATKSGKAGTAKSGKAGAATKPWFSRNSFRCSA